MIVDVSEPLVSTILTAYIYCDFYSGINAVASISIKKLGLAKPETMRTEMAGGFAVLLINF